MHTAEGWQCWCGQVTAQDGAVAVRMPDASLWVLEASLQVGSSSQRHSAWRTSEKQAGHNGAASAGLAVLRGLTHGFRACVNCNRE